MFFFKKPASDDEIRRQFFRNAPDVWAMLAWLIALGVILVALFNLLFIDPSIIFFSSKNIIHYLESFGILLLVAGASFTSGSLLGFLFAIPKMIQNNALLPDDIKANKTIILQNDNLVQISDWLTKIMVGVSLTQLNNIPGALLSLGGALKGSLGDGIQGRNAAITTVLYFAITGFLSAYLWTRLYFIRLLADTANIGNSGDSEISAENKKVPLT